MEDKMAAEAFGRARNYPGLNLVKYTNWQHDIAPLALGSFVNPER